MQRDALVFVINNVSATVPSLYDAGVAVNRKPCKSQTPMLYMAGGYFKDFHYETAFWWKWQRGTADFTSVKRVYMFSLRPAFLELGSDVASPDEENRRLYVPQCKNILELSFNPPNKNTAEAVFDTRFWFVLWRNCAGKCLVLKEDLHPVLIKAQQAVTHS